MSEVPVKSVKKALRLLSELVFCDADGHGLTLTVLARTLGSPLNTTHNLLKTMAACGYVAQNVDGNYVTGPQCRRIGLANQLTSDAFKEKLLDVMNRCTAVVNEATVFTVLRGGWRLVLARAEPAQQAVRIDPSADNAPSLYAVPTGRVLVACATPEERSLILAREGEPGERWPDAEAAMKRIQETGFCEMPAGARTEVRAYAVAVRDAKQRLLGAIGCHAPAFRCDRAAQKRIAAALRAAAAELATYLSAGG